jgi:hypothetical protein
MGETIKKLENLGKWKLSVWAIPWLKYRKIPLIHDEAICEL